MDDSVQRIALSNHPYFRMKDIADQKATGPNEIPSLYILWDWEICDALALAGDDDDDDNNNNNRHLYGAIYHELLFRGAQLYKGENKSQESKECHLCVKHYLERKVLNLDLKLALSPQTTLVLEVWMRNRCDDLKLRDGV